MLSTYRLQVLQELKQRGTLAKVAQALSYSPSAISQQLAQLEAEVGTPLLEAVGRGVRLTAQGELLAEHAGRILRHIEEAESALAESASHLTGRLRVATFQTAALTLMPAVLTALADSHPGLTLQFAEIQPDLAIPALAAHDYDVVLGEEYPGLELPRDAGIEQEDLMQDPLRAFYPETQLGHGRPSTLSELSTAPWVMESVGKPARAWAENACRRAGFEPDVRYESDDLIIHHTLVTTGHAAAMLPDLLRLASPERIRSLQLEGNPTRRIFTAIRAGARRRPAIGVFRDALKTAAS